FAADGGIPEQDFETGASIGHPAHLLTVTQPPTKAIQVNLTYSAPTMRADNVQSYLVYRGDGSSVTVANLSKKTLVASQPPGSAFSATDGKVTKGKTYTYLLI